ncbi:unnamed protein product, partial [Mesorhabditis spiculigera]
MIICRLSMTLCLVSALAEAIDVVGMGCDRDPSLPFCAGDRREQEFCQAFENICSKINEGSTLMSNSRVQAELAPIDGGDGDDRIFKHKERGREDSDTSSAPLASGGKKKKKRINFTRFCKEFKTRYLYICPDPFRFGQKAVLFCPIYSDHCHVPLPGKPVLPERKGRRSNSVQRLCAAYRGYAEQYCNNALLLSQPRYRDGCEKYWRFCLRRNG